MKPAHFADLTVYWLMAYARSRKAASSIKRDHGILKNYILPRFGKLDLCEIKARDVESWLSSLVIDQRMSTKSANDVLVVFRKIMNDAVRWEFVRENPLTKVAKFRVAERDFDFWKQSEVLTFLGAHLTITNVPRIFLPAAVALYTGLRRGEVQALRWEDINERAGLITVKRSYCRIAKQFKEETKSRKIRYVPICAALKALLQRLPRSESGLVVPFFNSDCYLKEFRKLSSKLTLPIIRFHDLRHTFASNFLMGGGSIYDLQRILGHSTVQVTERYGHLAPGHLRGKTEVLGF